MRMYVKNAISVIILNYSPVTLIQLVTSCGREAFMSTILNSQRLQTNDNDAEMRGV